MGFVDQPWEHGDEEDSVFEKVTSMHKQPNAKHLIDGHPSVCRGKRGSTAPRFATVGGRLLGLTMICLS
jgi:hypothetical protein